MKVRQTADMRREVDVEVMLERESLVARAPLRGEKFAIGCSLSVCPANDEGRVIEHATVVENEHRYRAGSAAHSLHRKAVKPGHVPFLAK
jgi:hypothetical protein